MGWLEFLNEESRDRIHRLRVMTEPEDVRSFLVHRLRAEFDFPRAASLVCAVEDRTADHLDLVPLDLDPGAYEALGPIRVPADVPYQPGSILQVDLVLDPPAEGGLSGRIRAADPLLGVEA